MKKFVIIMAALTVSLSVFAADVNVVLGSGTPGLNASGMENAKIVDNSAVENNIFHTPQYMPYNPTAATIWPRVVEVPCTKDSKGNLACSGYNWNPSLGRGEYLFVTPKIVEAPKPVIITVPGPVREVLVEVPAKKKAE